MELKIINKFETRHQLCALQHIIKYDKEMNIPLPFRPSITNLKNATNTKHIANTSLKHTYT